MRRVPLAAVTVLVLFGAACGGGPSTAQGTPSAAATISSTSSRSTAASVSFGTPVPATPTALVTTRPTTSATLAARTAAPTAPPGACAPGDVSITTSTDRSQYTPAQVVKVRVVVRNLSANGCVFSAPGDFAIEPDPSGAAVYAVHLACPAAGCQPLGPQAGTLTYPIDWNQIPNQGPATQPQGALHAKASFTGYPVSTSAPFTITP